MDGEGFILIEPKLTDIITEDRVRDIFEGRVDLEFQLAGYRSKNLILVYSYTDLLEGFKIRTHAISIKYSQT